jgi:hypothetical protein
MIDYSKYTDKENFMLMIESRHRFLIHCLIQEDCKNVEYTRGELSVYAEILKKYESWKAKPEIFYT